MLKLLQKYNRPVPRYTSYPTVPEWSDEFDAGDYRHALRSASAKSDCSLSFYVHIPFCCRRCYFCGCTTMVPSSQEVATRYLDVLEKEVELIATRLGERRNVAQLHWGGGTPTYLSEDELRRLHNLVADRFRFVDPTEIAVEVNPHVTTHDQVRLLRELGFNRISLGVQDFNVEVQQAIGRHQSLAETEQMYSLLRDLGFGGINLDLIYGLPHQTREIFADTIRKVIELRPDRIAIYSFAYLPDLKPHQRAIKEDTLPAPDDKQALFALAVEQLRADGY
jgi:oxygen-independent coproporphyrinogen-3 oxidase